MGALAVCKRRGNERHVSAGDRHVQLVVVFVLARMRVYRLRKLRHLRVGVLTGKQEKGGVPAFLSATAPAGLWHRRGRHCANMAVSERVCTFAGWQVRLDLAAHVYTATRGGQRAPGPVVSVTTFGGALFPAFDAASAVARMHGPRRAAKYGAMTDTQIVRYWDANRDHAADLGTRMHSVMEAWLGAIMADPAAAAATIPAVPAPRPPIYEDCVPRALVDDGVVVKAAHLRAFADYMRETDIVPVAAEKCVFAADLQMAGTVDAIFRRRATGELLLYDWKRRPEYTTENPWQCGLPGTPVAAMPDCHHAHATVQLNLYRELLRRGEGLQIGEMHIISLHPALADVLDSIVPIDLRLTAALLATRRAQLP